MVTRGLVSSGMRACVTLAGKLPRTAKVLAKGERSPERIIEEGDVRISCSLKIRCGNGGLSH